jgi:prepilin-type N-terminal cleavage/methylation domain-containing protein
MIEILLQHRGRDEMKKVNLKDKKGFTLLELIVVILVVGILASIAIPGFSGFVETAKVAADEADMKTLNTLTVAYRAGGLAVDPFKDTTNTDTRLMEFLVEDGFLKAVLQPRQENVDYAWDFQGESWTMGDALIVVTGDLVTFGTTSPWFKVRILAYSGTAQDIIIPQTINGTRVEGIYQDAFRDKGLTSLIFSEDSVVTQIHGRAFQDNDLTEVVLPDSLTRLDGLAFKGNPIAKVTIGANVILGDKVFLDNNSFKEAYEELGKSAGTYYLVDGSWVKR